MSLLAAIFQLLLELKQGSQTGTALQYRDKIKAAVLLDKSYSAPLAQSAQFTCVCGIIGTSVVLVCLGMQIFHVPVDNFPERHTLFEELVLEDVETMFDFSLLDVIVDLTLHKLSNHANLDPLLSHLL